MNRYQKYLTTWGLVVVILCILAAIISLVMRDIRFGFGVAFGVVWVLFIPGYVVVKLFLQDLEIVEEIVLSFALSIALVPFVVLVANRFLNIRFSALSVIIEVLAFILLALALAFVRRNFFSSKKKKK